MAIYTFTDNMLAGPPRVPNHIINYKKGALLREGPFTIHTTLLLYLLIHAVEHPVQEDGRFRPCCAAIWMQLPSAALKETFLQQIG
ncbi:hypothetical protein [Paenibacillus apiarius]|uniref:Uncharacterized protein n=1 Tax=Paenibacillus apiarius TaxID=46240 RepID=A0ABT4DZF9_9BACL|nr:hypothetical protein [Paenibacillus apiarius]MCY9522605.1 hypothetical protein [Paenibacillus apiarius]MCY9686486.1 hypothetical protein [Paenibacillus apiarius]MEC0191891.1 hypothetical protein [Paenibacillus apiarius]